MPTEKNEQLMTKVLEIETKVDDTTTKLTNLKLQWNAMFPFHGAAKTSIKRKIKESRWQGN
jgi:hypothetical protein